MSAYKNEDLYNAVNELHIIDEDVLKLILEESNNTNIPFDNLLYNRDLISDENLGKIIGELISVPFVNLNDISIPTEVLKIIPESVAKAQHIIAFKKKQRRIICCNRQSK